MSIDFPNSPTIGQTYTFGNKTWEWNGSAWTLLDTITDASKFATTGSNTFAGNQVISGSVEVDNDISTNSNLIVSGNATISGTGDILVGEPGSTLRVNSSNIIFRDNELSVNDAGATTWVLKIKPNLSLNPTASAADSGSLRWLQSQDYWQAGRLGDLQRILRQEDLDIINTFTSSFAPLSEGNVWVGNDVGTTISISTSSLDVSTSVSASYAVSSSHTLNADNAISASFAVTSSQADNVKVLTSASYAAITPVSGTIYIVTE